MSSLANFVMLDCLNCLHYLSMAWSDDQSKRSKILSWNQPAMVFSLFFVCFCHFVLSSLAENVRTSCSCCFLGLWPKMFGLIFDKHESTKEICLTETKVFSFFFQTWLGKPTKCTDRHPAAPYRFLFPGTVYNFQEDLSLELPSL